MPVLCDCHNWYSVGVYHPFLNPVVVVTVLYIVTCSE